MVNRLGAIGFFLAVLPACASSAAELVRVEGTIPLGSIAGRIDHVAVDLARRRLYVAELGNDSVSVVEVADREVTRRIDGLSEPQGVAYEAATDTLVITNGGDGSVRMFSAQTFQPTGRIDLSDDADNIRIDATAKRLLVG